MTWTIATTVTSPLLNQPKHTHWSWMDGELFAAEWDLLLCSAGALSAVICEVARHRGHWAIDIGELDVAFLGMRFRSQPTPVPGVVP